MEAKAGNERKLNANNRDSLYNKRLTNVTKARTISPTPPVIEISIPGKSLWDPPPPPLLPLDGFCLGE